MTIPFGFYTQLQLAHLTIAQQKETIDSLTSVITKASKEMPEGTLRCMPIIEAVKRLTSAYYAGLVMNPDAPIVENAGPVPDPVFKTVRNRPPACHNRLVRPADWWVERDPITGRTEYFRIRSVGDDRYETL